MTANTTFASVRLVTEQPERLAHFYAAVIGCEPNWLVPGQYAELATPGGTLCLAHVETVRRFNAGAAPAAENRSAILEFRVTDVDATLDALHAVLTDVVQPPTDMPWGNRSLLVRDPDGSLVNLYHPATPEARARYGM